MKTLIKSLLLAFSLSFVAFSVSEAKPGRPAAATFKTGIYTSANSKLNIALDKQIGGAVDIQLKTTNGVLLYTQRVGKKEESFRIRLNLDELADGDYVLEITNGVQLTRQTVSLKTRQPAALNRVIQTELSAINE